MSWWNRGDCGEVLPPMFKRLSDDKHSTPTSPSANNHFHRLQKLTNFTDAVGTLMINIQMQKVFLQIACAPNLQQVGGK